jgi:CelD/BcsL family acetyltransferase involved in cellulose biosynthesis
MSALNEPSGCLFADAEALRALVTAVLGLGRPVLLQRLERHSPIHAQLRELPSPGIVFNRQTAPSLSIRVRTSWADYFDSLPSSITHNLQRLKVRARSLGEPSVEVLAPEESQVDGLLKEFMRVEASGWKGLRGSAMLQQPSLRDFFSAYARLAARQGILRMALLRFGSRIAAVEMAVEMYRRWWQLKIGYANDLAQHYPGLQLTEATIRHAFDRGLRSYEFMGSAATWEERWKPEQREYCTTVVYPRTLSGARALSVDACLTAGRRLKRSVISRLVSRTA